MEICALRKRCFLPFAAIVLLPVFLCSCVSSRTIPYTQVGKKNNPDIIQLKDNSSYVIYSCQVRCKTSGDSLIIYNKRNFSAYDTIPGNNISQVVVIHDLKRDSPWWPVLYVLFELFDIIFL